MQPSPQSSETRSASPVRPLGRLRRSRRLNRLITDWGTTPGKLRVTRVVLVLGIVLSGSVAGYTTNARMEATQEIDSIIEPLNDTVTTVYRSLADADATVTSAFLSGDVQMQDLYDADVEMAANYLTKASSLAGDDLVTADRISDITAQLPVYTSLVGQARANMPSDAAGGVADLQRASEFMQSSMLPEAEALQREQADRLKKAYERASPVPVRALAVCAVSLAGLIWAQVFLFRRTRRVVNIGLLTATGAVVAGLVWWTVAGLKSADYLESSYGHSRSISDGLAPAQIAALQARAIENIALVTRNGAGSQSDFEGKMSVLAHDDGAGGALGAARELVTDPGSETLVEDAVDKARDYRIAHEEVQQLATEEDYSRAVSTAQNSAAPAFDQLDDILTSAIIYERERFDADFTNFSPDIRKADPWLAGLLIGTGVLALAAVAGVMWGIGRRLEEYR